MNQNARTLPAREIILGDKLNIGLKNLNEGGPDMTGSTGTVSIYDSLGNTIVNAASLTITGTVKLLALYFLVTGSGGVITSVTDPNGDSYRADYVITDPSGNRQTWQQKFLLLPKPY